MLSLGSKGWGGASSLFGGMESVLTRVTSAIRRTSGAFGALIQRFRTGISYINPFHSSLKKTNSTFGGGLKNILKYTIGIRSLFVLFNRLRSAGAEGFQNLAQYSNKTNRSISLLMSSFTQLKNSVAAAFAPVLNVVSPILDVVIQKIISVMNVIGQLTSALTGSGTYIRAKKVNQDYAASLDKNASSAKNADKANRELQRTILGFDQINKMDSNTDSSNMSTDGIGGNAGALAAEDMFETVRIKSSIKSLADTIRDYIKAEDWEGLGRYVADGINSGMRKVYDAISWDKVGPKVTRTVTAFTRTFNSMSRNINWGLLGATMGAGMNTAIRTLNLLIGNGGIDFSRIGRNLAKALRGMIRELDWNSLGDLLGNKFMIPWRMLSGFVMEMGHKDGAGITGWRSLGNGIGRSMTSIFEQISIKDIANAMVGVLNGAFQTLDGFNEEFDWEGFKTNLGSGIKAAINGIEWKENGKAFGEFLSNLCDCIKASMDRDTFYGIGKGIGEFLGELPWSEILLTAAGLIIDGLGGALAGLSESGTAGSIASFLSKAFIAVKISDILDNMK